MDKPSSKQEVQNMNTKYVIATVAIIAIIAVASFIYVYSQGQSDEQIEALHNLVDDTGYKTSMDALPNKIISLAPSTTEILFALGLDDKVVAVSDWCDYPYDFSAWIAAGNMSSIGDFSAPNMEVIATLEPDLILATGGVQAETVDTLRSLGKNVLILDPADIDGVLQDIELVGNATGKAAEAEALNANLKSRIDAVVATVANAASKPTVYYEVWNDPLMSAGAEAWQNGLITTAGGINIFGDQNLSYFTTSYEAVITLNPDVIVLPDEAMGSQFWGSIEEVRARPGWSAISAIQNDRICLANSNTIARAGPRVADIVEDLAAAFHPELF